MTSPVHADSYLPVDPDTQIVHRDAGHLNPDMTACGLDVPWCKNIMLIAPTYEWCPTCWENE